MIQLVLLSYNPCMSTSPLSRSFSLPVGGLGFELSMFACAGTPVPSVSRPIFINGSSRTRLELVASVASSANSSFNSSCLPTTNPPCLHASACSTENYAPQPSHFRGNPSNAIPYLIRIPSLNSSLDSESPLTVVGMMDSHAPVSLALSVFLRMRGRITWSRGVRERRERSMLDAFAFFLPSCMVVVWDRLLNSCLPRRELVRTEVHAVDVS